jgi:hypothetical protein
MKRAIVSVSVAILFIALAGSLSGYYFGFSVSDVAAQDDHGDDGGGDVGGGDDGGGDVGGGDVGGGGDGGGGDDGGGGHDEGGGNSAGDGDGHDVLASDGRDLGDLDRAGEAVVVNCFECGRYIDPGCPGCGGYIDGDPTFVPGPKIFDSNVGLWYVIPAAGTDYDPRAVVIHDSSSDTHFFGHDDDQPFDKEETRFLDPATNKLLDSRSIQFYDAATGEVINPDSAEASGNGFNYEIRSDDALAAYEQALEIVLGDLESNPEVAVDIAQNLDFRGFKDLGSEAVFDILKAMDSQAFVDSDGSVKAGIFNALDAQAFDELGGEQVVEAAKQMQREDFTGMGADQASLMFDTMGLDQSLGLETAVFAGMVSRFDASQFHQMGGENVIQVVGALTKADLAGLRNEQAFSVVNTLDVGQISGLEAGRLSGLTIALEANDVDNLGSEVVTAIAGNIEVAELEALDSGLASSIMKQVPDGALNDFADDRIVATLAVLGADFLGAGAADFSNIANRVTTFDHVLFETPPALLELLAEETAGNIFGGLFGSG